jgi:DNA-binding transcriptional LysR family regulator
VPAVIRDCARHGGSRRRSGERRRRPRRWRRGERKLSEQVRRLEAELGVALFHRVGRGLAPTEAARALRPHAERTLEAAEAARESVVAVRELRGGIATFGTWGTARYYPGVDIIAEFRRRHPGVRVRVVGQNSNEVVDAVREGELEAGMVALPIDGRGLEVQPIMRDELVCVSADRARVRTPATIETLVEGPLILSDASWGNEDPTRRQLTELAQRVGLSLQPEIDVEDVEAAIELAARGLGDTIVARGILLALGRRVPRRLGWIPFDEPLYDTFAFIARTDAPLSPASREFLALARERLATLARTLRTTPPRRRRPAPSQ